MIVDLPSTMAAFSNRFVSHKWGSTPQQVAENYQTKSGPFLLDLRFRNEHAEIDHLQLMNVKPQIFIGL